MCPAPTSFWRSGSGGENRSQLCCFLIVISPVEVDSAPSTEKEAVVAKSKMAVVAGPESPQDATQKVISEPGNQAEISALAYELWVQRDAQ